MDSSEATIAFRIPPLPRVCRTVREGVSEFALAHGVDRDELDQFQTALGEAMANAIEHSQSADEIEIEVRITRDQIVATVCDGGIGFSHDTHGRAALPDMISERGRGLPIMRRCSDIFSVQSAPGEGTRVRIGRYLRPICEGAA